MGNENQELIEKTVTTAAMTFGGQLNPAQQDEFVRLVKDNSVLLKNVRFKQMATASELIDKIYIGEPVTAPATENSGTNYANGSKPVFDQIRLTASKTKSFWSISTEQLQENIEGDNFEQVMMEMMAKRIATDIELLAIQGDSTITPTTPLTTLLSTFDGFGKLTEQSQIVDAQGGSITAGLFADAVRAMPEQYLQDPDLMWVMSRAAATDWQEKVAQRETAAGDDALRGNTLRPYGFPVMIVPGLPSRLALSVGDPTAAESVAAEFGPYELTASNNTFSINVNGLGAVAVTIAEGVYTASELAYAIRDFLVNAGAPGPATNAALTIKDDGQGRLALITNAAGAATSIVFTAAAGFLSETGLADSAGSAAGAGTVNEGTYLFLINPKNLIFGMVDDTRVYSEFNKDNDRTETVIYNQLAVNIENPEAIVKVKNVRVGRV